MIYFQSTRKSDPNQFFVTFQIHSFMLHTYIHKYIYIVIYTGGQKVRKNFKTLLNLEN